MCHTKNQENLNLNEKRQSTDTKSSWTQMLKMFYKSFKAAIRKVLWQAVNKRAWKKIVSLSKEVENLRKEIEDIKENQLDIFKLESKINKNFKWFLSVCLLVAQSCPTLQPHEL